MKRKTLALLLAGALSLSLLAGCGGDADTTPSPDADPTPSQQATPAPTPEATPNVTPDATPSVSPDESEVVAALALSHSDVTLKMAGGSFVLKGTLTGLEGGLTYAADNEAVATVDEKGKVTAVAPGSATITVAAQADEKLTAKCIVRCSWTEATPAPTPSPTPSETPSAGVSLSDFYTSTTSKYEFQTLTNFEGETLENYYPGMGAVSTKQRLIMGTMMTMNNGEFCLVEVSDSKDVATVKAIFQARVDYMVDGGAWYPGPTELWTNSSRIVSNGNYVMMVVHEQADSIVSDFNALF